MKRRVLTVMVIMAVLAFTGGAWGGTEGNINTFYGKGAGNSTTGDDDYDTFIGANAGYNNTTGNYNTFLGLGAGYSNSSGSGNTFLGNYAGNANTSGKYNTFVGYGVGFSHNNGGYNTFVGNGAGFTNTGNRNTFLGNYAGYSHVTGNNNTLIGGDAGYANTTGGYNTFLGYRCGYANAGGSGNVFLGYGAGYSEKGSNKLYIANSDTSAPLIYGEFNNKILAINGKVGIGTQTPKYPLQMAAGAYTDGKSWIDVSSREYKADIEELSAEEAIAAMQELNPVKYSYKADQTERRVGFIAEEVPELVAMKDRKGLSAMDIVAVLTKVVQGQQKAIQEQQKTIEELKGKVMGLERELKRR